MMNIASCKQENAVIIGVNYEGSGALASYGKAMLDGVRLAVEELGDGYRMVCADNRSFGADSAAAILYLKNVCRADVIIGPSTGTLAKAALAAQADTLMITPSATSDELKSTVHTKLVRLCFSDRVQGAAMGKYAARRGVRRAAIVRDLSSDYATGCTRSFKAAFDGEIVYEGAFLSGECDFSAMITELKAAAPQAVYLPAYYTEAGLFIRQCRQQGFEPLFLGGDAMDSPLLLQLAGEGGEIVYTDHFTVQEEAYAAFAERFMQRYDTAPPAYAALAYDCVMLYASCVEKAGVAGAEREIFAASDYRGVTGTLNIGADGNAQKAPVFVSPGGNGCSS